MTFYRTKDCPGCRAVEETLNDLAMAVRCVAVQDKSELPAELAGCKLPLLVDEGSIIQGSDKILDHLEQLADFKKQWYKYQSDACYCSEET
jgi:glutaredoxin